MTTVRMYRHPENWASLPIYAARLMALPTYYVGQCVIEDGPDAVEGFIKATVETSMADAALDRIRSFLWDHTRGRAITTCGGGPGSADYIELHMGKYNGGDARFDESWRWIVNIGWDEVSAEESDDYFIRVTYGALIVDKDGNEEHLWQYETIDYGTDPELTDVMAVCEAVGEYVKDHNIPAVESTYTV